jgi:penicillin amidase
MDDPNLRYRWFLPQGMPGWPAMDWIPGELVTRSHARNPKRGFFNGWNNKTSPVYYNAFNSNNDIYGPFQRAHVIEEYLSSHNDLAFEEIRDLALNIATTDSFNGGGNPWAFVAKEFTDILPPEDERTDYQEVALDTLKDWDGHFVDGGQSEWAFGDTRAKGWVLMNDWLREVISLTFADELYDEDEGKYLAWNNTLLFNVILHAIEKEDNGIATPYNWFNNMKTPGAPQTLEDIVISALDKVMEGYDGVIPSTEPRGNIVYNHAILGRPVCEATPYSSRSTYAHVVEFGRKGPVRIESMFPLGESGYISQDLELDDNFCSMESIYNGFAPRDFPLFTKMRHGKK